MKIFTSIIFVMVVKLYFTQPAIENMTTYVNLNAGRDGVYTIDSSYHIKLKEGKWAFFDRDSNQIFSDKFDEYPRYIGSSFFAFKNESSTFLLSPKLKRKFVISKNFDGLYDFYYLEILNSTFSNDTLIALNKYFINFKNEIILPGDVYTEVENKNKKINFKSEDDLYLEDQGQAWQEMDSSKFDDFTKEMIFLNKYKNQFFNENQFDDYYPLYENISFVFNQFSHTERYYSVKKNGKWGVVSTNGKIILPFEFSKISCINQEHFYLYNENGSFIKAVRNKNDEIYDLQGNFLFAQNYIEEESYLESQGNFAYVYYEGFPIRKGNKSGILSIDGKTIIPPIYDYYDFFDFKSSNNIKAINNYNLSTSCLDYSYSQYFIGQNKKSNLFHFYAPNGKFLNTIESDGFEFYNQFGYISYYLNDKYGLIGPGACKLIEPKFDYISIFQGKRKIFAISTDTTNYFINEKLEPLFGPNVYGSFVDSTYAIVTKNGRTGVIDVLKSIDSLFWIIPPKYDNVVAEFPFISKNVVHFKVKIDDYFGLISTEDKILYPIQYEKLLINNEFLISVKNGFFGLSKYLGSEYLKHEYDKIEEFNSSVFKVKKDNKVFLYSCYSSQQLTKEYQEIEKIQRNYNHYLVKQNNKYGIINFSHEEIIPTIYKLIYFDEVSNEFECYKDNGDKDCFFVK